MTLSRRATAQIVHGGLRTALVAVAAACSSGAGVDGSLPDFDEPPVISDELSQFDGQVWTKADWWNGADFDSSFLPSRVAHSDGAMQLTLSPGGCPCHERSLAAGEVRTQRAFVYGRLQARLRAATGSGLVSGLFLYTGKTFGHPHDEIDVEILGQDPSTAVLGYFKAGKQAGVAKVALGFDASADYHTYAIDWLPDRIRWWVDGKLVHEVSGAPEQLPSHPSRVYVNLWRCADSNWCGAHESDQAQLSVDWLRYWRHREVMQ